MRRFLLRLFHPLVARKADLDFDREIESHLALLQENYERQGLPSREARRAALLSYGGVEQAKELQRDARGFPWLDHLLKDLSYAARNMATSPAFTLIVTAILALGIGACTSIFSVIKPILLEPLPYPHAERLIMIWDVSDGQLADPTFHTYCELLTRNHALLTIGAADRIPWQPTLSGNQTTPERLDGQSITESYFRTLGIAPSLGRNFDASEDRVHGPKVVILSDALWRRRFAADHTLIGKQIRLADDLWTVVGVMPPGFHNALSPSSEIWRPLQYDPQHATQFQTAEWGHHLEILVRVGSDRMLQQAQKEVDKIASHPITEFPRPPWASLASGFVLEPLQHYTTRGIKPTLLALGGGVLLLLLIVCVNVSSLLLGRGAQRRGEFAIRAALGAGKVRLINQLLVESVLLAFLGGLLGVIVAQLGISAFVSLSPSSLPGVGAIQLEREAFLFTFLVTAIVGISAGLVPALDAGNSHLASELRKSSQRIAGRHLLIRRTLVVAEVAVALVLLLSAGLLLQSLRRLSAIEPGFSQTHLLTMEIRISGHRYDQQEANNRFLAQSLDAVRRVPGVIVASSTNILPFGRFQADAYYGVRFEDRRSYGVCRYVVSPGYFDAMRIPLRRGRFLGDHDTTGAPPAAVISESLARREFGKADPLGKRLQIGPADRPWLTVVGVVGDVKQVSLTENQLDAVYITPSQSWFGDDTVAMVVRSAGEPLALQSAIKSAIWSVDKDEAITHIATMEELLKDSASERRLVLILFATFALAACLLAALGLYGVLAGNVNDRVREIGVRTALGASRVEILTMVIHQGLQLAGIGVATGLLAAALATRALGALLFGVSPLDPVTYMLVVLFIAAVAVAACWIPAWRAAKVDPAIALRAE